MAFDVSLSPDSRKFALPVATMSRRYVAIKAVLDGASAALLLVLSAPLLALALALVCATSPGFPFASQVRLGRGGRPYRMYRIRTVSYEGERCPNAGWSGGGGPRVTPLGRVLRRWRLDELPLLWNVVRGEMSLVGPRPERPEITAQLERVLPAYRGRLQVRPGITGLAQVHLPPAADLAGVRRKLSCDLHYVARMGPWLDARVLAASALKPLGASAELRCRLLGLPASSREPASELQAV